MAPFEPVAKPITISLIRDSGPDFTSMLPGMSFSFAALCKENRIIGGEG